MRDEWGSMSGVYAGRFLDCKLKINLSIEWRQK